MKKTLVFILLIFVYFVVYSQQESNLNTDYLSEKISSVNKSGMLVLGAWGISNLLAGSVINFTGQGQSKYFGQMNAAWNTVNISIAAIGYFGSGIEYSSASEMLNQFESYKRAYLFNAGLDVGYIMTGFYLKELAKRKPGHAERLRGYGNSIILQGAFLMAFDVAMYAINQHQYKVHISPWINELSNSAGLSLSLTF